MWYNDFMSMRLAEPQTRRWTSQEYHRLAEQGWFDGQRVQLIDGEIIQMPAMGYPHAKAVSRIERLLERIFEPTDWVRSQLPLAVSSEHEPEPDISVIKGRPENYPDHPSTALLVVEISDTSLRLDRRMTGVYASAGVLEYWIVNLAKRELEVYRDPQPDSTREFGFRYADARKVAATDTIAPLARPQASIAVADLLP